MSIIKKAFLSILACVASFATSPAQAGMVDAVCNMSSAVPIYLRGDLPEYDAVDYRIIYNDSDEGFVDHVVDNIDMRVFANLACIGDCLYRKMNYAYGDSIGAWISYATEVSALANKIYDGFVDDVVTEAVDRFNEIRCQSEAAVGSILSETDIITETQDTLTGISDYYTGIAGIRSTAARIASAKRRITGIAEVDNALSGEIDAGKAELERQIEALPVMDDIHNIQDQTITEIEQVKRVIDQAQGYADEVADQMQEIQNRVEEVTNILNRIQKQVCGAVVKKEKESHPGNDIIPITSSNSLCAQFINAENDRRVCMARIDSEVSAENPLTQVVNPDDGCNKHRRRYNQQSENDRCRALVTTEIHRANAENSHIELRGDECDPFRQAHNEGKNLATGEDRCVQPGSTPQADIQADIGVAGDTNEDDALELDECVDDDMQKLLDLIQKLATIAEALLVIDEIAEIYFDILALIEYYQKALKYYKLITYIYQNATAAIQAIQIIYNVISTFSLPISYSSMLTMAEATRDAWNTLNEFIEVACELRSEVQKFNQYLDEIKALTRSIKGGIEGLGDFDPSVDDIYAVYRRWRELRSEQRSSAPRPPQATSPQQNDLPQTTAEMQDGIAENNEALKSELDRAKQDATFWQDASRVLQEDIFSDDNISGLRNLSTTLGNQANGILNRIPMVADITGEALDLLWEIEYEEASCVATGDDYINIPDELTAKREERAALITQRSTLEAEIANHQDEISSLDDLSGNESEAQAALERRQDDFRGRQETLGIQLDILRVRRSSANSDEDRESIDNEIAEKESELDYVESELSNMQNSSEYLSNTSNRQADLQNLIQTKRDEITQISANIDALEGDITEYEYVLAHSNEYNIDQYGGACADDVNRTQAEVDQDTPENSSAPDVYELRKRLERKAVYVCDVDHLVGQARNVDTSNTPKLEPMVAVTNYAEKQCEINVSGAAEKAQELLDSTIEAISHTEQRIQATNAQLGNLNAMLNDPAYTNDEAARDSIQTRIQNTQDTIQKLQNDKARYEEQRSTVSSEINEMRSLNEAGTLSVSQLNRYNGYCAKYNPSCLGNLGIFTRSTVLTENPAPVSLAESYSSTNRYDCNAQQARVYWTEVNNIYGDLIGHGSRLNDLYQRLMGLNGGNILSQIDGVQALIEQFQNIENYIEDIRELQDMLSNANSVLDNGLEALADAPDELKECLKIDVSTLADEMLDAVIDVARDTIANKLTYYFGKAGENLPYLILPEYDYRVGDPLKEFKNKYQRSIEENTGTIEISDYTPQENDLIDFQSYKGSDDLTSDDAYALASQMGPVLSEKAQTFLQDIISGQNTVYLNYMKNLKLDTKPAALSSEASYEVASIFGNETALSLEENKDWLKTATAQVAGNQTCPDGVRYEYDIDGNKTFDNGVDSAECQAWRETWGDASAENDEVMTHYNRGQECPDHVRYEKDDDGNVIRDRGANGPECQSWNATWQGMNSSANVSYSSGRTTCPRNIRYEYGSHGEIIRDRGEGGRECMAWYEEHYRNDLENRLNGINVDPVVEENVVLDEFGHTEITPDLENIVNSEEDLMGEATGALNDYMPGEDDAIVDAIMRPQDMSAFNDYHIKNLGSNSGGWGNLGMSRKSASMMLRSFEKPDLKDVLKLPEFDMDEGGPHLRKEFGSDIIGKLYPPSPLTWAKCGPPRSPQELMHNTCYYRMPFRICYFYCFKFMLYTFLPACQNAVEYKEPIAHVEISPRYGTSVLGNLSFFNILGTMDRRNFDLGEGLENFMSGKRYGQKFGSGGDNDGIMQAHVYGITPLARALSAMTPLYAPITLSCDILAYKNQENQNPMSDETWYISSALILPTPIVGAIMNFIEQFIGMQSWRRDWFRPHAPMLGKLAYPLAALYLSEEEQTKWNPRIYTCGGIDMLTFTGENADTFEEKMQEYHGRNITFDRTEMLRHSVDYWAPQINSQMLTADYWRDQLSLTENADSNQIAVGSEGCYRRRTDLSNPFIPKELCANLCSVGKPNEHNICIGSWGALFPRNGHHYYRQISTNQNPLRHLRSFALLAYRAFDRAIEYRYISKFKRQKGTDAYGKGYHNWWMSFEWPYESAKFRVGDNFEHLIKRGPRNQGYTGGMITTMWKETECCYKTCCDPYSWLPIFRVAKITDPMTFLASDQRIPVGQVMQSIPMILFLGAGNKPWRVQDWHHVK